MGKDLRAADYKRWAPKLKLKINKYQPRICWFHGKVAIQNFLKYTNGEKTEIEWGMQSFRIINSNVFVSPNPSPANAAYSLDVIRDWYSLLYNSTKNELDRGNP